MAKETYSDKDLLMLKGLYHVSIAKQYFETTKIDKEFLIKNIFNSYCNRLDYILNSVNSMVNGESKAILDQEVLKGDTLFFGSMADKMINLSATQREQVEFIIDGYLKDDQVGFND